MICTCEDFKKACEQSTDNEEYGPLFYFDRGVHRAGVDSWRVGADVLAAPKYCPWCGNTLPPPLRESVVS